MGSCLVYPTANHVLWITGTDQCVMFNLKVALHWHSAGTSVLATWKHEHKWVGPCQFWAGQAGQLRREEGHRGSRRVTVPQRMSQWHQKDDLKGSQVDLIGTGRNTEATWRIMCTKWPLSPSSQSTWYFDVAIKWHSSYSPQTSRSHIILSRMCGLIYTQLQDQSIYLSLHSSIHPSISWLN